MDTVIHIYFFSMPVALYLLWRQTGPPRDFPDLVIHVVCVILWPGVVTTLVLDRVRRRRLRSPIPRNWRI